MNTLPSETQLRDLSELVLKNQALLNTKAYDEKWMGYAVTGHFDYALATGVEIVEFANSWNKWCWWSKAEPDEMAQLNMKVECVDALHFIASDILVQFKDALPGDAELAMRVALDSAQRGGQVFPLDELRNEYIKSRIKLLLQYAGRACPGTKDHAIDALVHLYQICMYACKLGFGELVAMYLAKSTLNRFRQDNGYREKKYTKIWAVSDKYGQVEDNMVLMRWVDQQDKTPNQAQVYEYLTQTYAKVCSQ